MLSFATSFVCPQRTIFFRNLSFTRGIAGGGHWLSKRGTSHQTVEKTSGPFTEYVSQSQSGDNTEDAMPVEDSAASLESTKSKDAIHDRQEEEDIYFPISSLHEGTPIEECFLEFETKVPTISPSKLPPSLANPDLAPYISPFLWSRARKTVNLILSVMVTCLSASAAGSYNPPSDVLMEKWGISFVKYEIGITIFCLGFAFTPMLLAPFSELNGRRPMLLPSGLVMTVALVGCGATDSYAGMLVARFFTGAGASTFSSIICGVISDMYETSERNTPMSIFAAASLFGTGLGPLCCSLIAWHASWRWVFYSQSIACGVVLVALFFLMDESRGSVLLTRKAKVLNTFYEKVEQSGHYGLTFASNPRFPDDSPKRIRLRWKVRADEERESLGKMLTISIYRPFCEFLRNTQRFSC